jgi:hypothetical protein
MLQHRYERIGSLSKLLNYKNSKLRKEEGKEAGML